MPFAATYRVRSSIRETPRSCYSGYRRKPQIGTCGGPLNAAASICQRHPGDPRRGRRSFTFGPAGKANGKPGRNQAPGPERETDEGPGAADKER